MNRQAGDTLFTIGHSTRTLTEFVALLRQVDVTLLVDVRSIPRSGTTPQFNLDTLPDSLAAEGISYRHLQVLGGRRHHRKGAPPSLNTYWRVAAFRNYADYAEADEFRGGLDVLRALTLDTRCAIMCAEAGGGAVIAGSSPITCWPAGHASSTSWDLVKSSRRRSRPVCASWPTGRCTIPRRRTRRRPRVAFEQFLEHRDDDYSSRRQARIMGRGNPFPGTDGRETHVSAGSCQAMVSRKELSTSASTLCGRSQSSITT
jgi:Protein of unknown function, DUF488